MENKKYKLLERLPEYIRDRIRVLPNDCWDWTGRVDEAGYGEFDYQGKSLRAHRVVWVFTGGYLDNRKTLDHLCCRISCVNPNHLQQVTQSVNTKRMQKRLKQQRAERYGRRANEGE